MSGNRVNTTTHGASHECYEDSDDEQMDSFDVEVDEYRGSPEFDLSALEATAHGTNVMNVRESTNVEFKPATYIKGGVTIHQYLNGRSYPKNFSPQELGAPVSKTSQNGTNSMNRKGDEEENPPAVLDTTSKKLCHSLRSRIPLKVGLIITATGVILTCVVIVYFAVLRHDMSDDTPFPLPPPEEGENDLGNDIHIIRRSRWGGFPIRDGYQNRTLEHPIRLVIIGHTAGNQCMTVETCSSTLQTIQTMHVARGWVDVGFNYLIGGDGNIYDALAWNITNYIKAKSIMISFFGNYVIHHVNDRQKMALELLLDQGIKLGKLDPKYLLVAHNQVTNTLSPGTHLREYIMQLPHYYNGTFT